MHASFVLLRSPLVNSGEQQFGVLGTLSKLGSGSAVTVKEELTLQGPWRVESDSFGLSDLNVECRTKDDVPVAERSHVYHSMKI